MRIIPLVHINFPLCEIRINFDGYEVNRDKTAHLGAGPKSRCECLYPSGYVSLLPLQMESDKRWVIDGTTNFTL